MPVNFQTSKDIPLHGFLRGINALVDPDIAVLDVEEVPPGWNARRAAAAKTYRFQYQLGPSRMPLLTRNAWYVKREDLDLEAMRRAAALLIGEHDFSSFRAAGCNAKTTWRRIYDVSFERSPDGNLIIMHITGNAFLRHMVRILAGTLFEVGIGRLSIDGFAEALAAQHRPAAGVTAGPEGLTLVTVHFEGYAKLGPIGQSSNTL